MKYQVVYQEHEDAYGNWLVRNERGEYAAACSGVQGAKKRRWRTAELAIAYMDRRADVDVHLVWLSEPTVCQAKPGATSVRHVGMHPSMAAAYKPAHGGYPTPREREKRDLFMFSYGTNTGRMVSNTPNFEEIPRRSNEVPPVGTVHTGGNEEAATIPDAVLFMAIVDAGNPDSLLRGLLAARSLFPKL